MSVLASAVTENSKLRGTVMVALSGMLYGLLGYFGIQLINQGLSVPNMLFWRFFIATVWMLGLSVISGQRTDARLGRHTILLGAIGAICYIGGSAFYYLSAIHIGTGPAMVLMYSFPIFVVFLAMLFDSWQLNRYTSLALVLVFTGLVLLSGRGDHTLDVIGVVFGLLSALCYGCYVYYSQSSSKKVNTRILTFLVCLGCTVAFFILSLVTHSLILPNTMQSWIDIFILAIVATAIPIQLLLNGLKYISHIKASILSMLEPAVTVLIGVAFLNEHLARLQILGIGIIVLGAVAIQFEENPDCDVPLK